MIGNRRATVSLVMIVRNEERHLAGCLQPVAALFDEIIIVDTGSTDATKHVAAGFNAKVVDFVWCDDFAAARNECLRHATGDWIFWLDADDRLSADAVAKLKALLDSLDGSLRAYMMDTVCSSEFISDGYTLISHPRLFRRHADLTWCGRVHEQLRSLHGPLGLETVWCDIRIDHLGYQDRALQQRKMQRNLRLLRMDYAVNPEDESTLLHLGLTYFHLGRWEDARRCLANIVSSGKHERQHLRQVFACLAQIAAKSGDIAGALRMIREGLAAFPGDHYLLYLQAECLYEVDDYASAAASLRAIQTNNNAIPYQGGVPGDLRDYFAPRRLADVLRLQQRYAEAEALILSLIQKRPLDAHAWHTLGRIYLDCGMRDALLMVVERMKACPEGDVFGRILLALWHLNTLEYGSATQHIDWLVAKAPRMPLPRVLRAEILGRIGAPLVDRIKACHDVLRLQPGNLDVQRLLHALKVAEQATTFVDQSVGMMAGTGGMSAAVSS